MSDDAMWETCNCTTVRRASRRLARMYDEAISAAGLRSTQWSILISLRESGPLPLGMCAEKLTMDRATLTHNLRPLERDGLVTVTPDSADRRSKRVELTDDGRERLRLGRDGWSQAQDRVEEHLGTADASELRRLLRRLLEIPIGADAST